MVGKMLAKVLCLVLVAAWAAPAAAELQWVYFHDTPSQDWIPTGDILVDELGWKPPFPSDEWITSSYRTTEYQPCLENEDDPFKPNMEVTITNRADMNGDGIPDRDFPWLYYVADHPGTGLTNDDGLVNSGLAFRIDWVGANKPLIFESMAMDTVFQAGETWKFVIQDYTNTFLLPPHQFDSIGVGNMSGGGPPSSGSIIPEPASLSLLALAGLALLRRRR